MKKTITFVFCFCTTVMACALLGGCSHSHKFSKVYDYNDEYHWKVCVSAPNCDKTEEYESHIFGDWITQEKKTCTTDEILYRTCKCGYVEYSKGESASHNLSSEWSKDGQYHWHICEKCHSHLEISSHVADANGICTVCHNGAAVKIDNTYYKTLSDAIDSISDDTPTTILFQKNISDSGISIASNRNITFDLCGNFYIITSPSSNQDIKNSGILIGENSNVTIKNGTISHETKHTSSQQNCVQQLINSAGNLTLENVSVDAQNKASQSEKLCLSAIYVRDGSLLVKGNTNIIADNLQTQSTYAMFAALSFCSTSTSEISICFDKSFVGYVRGKVECIDSQSQPSLWPEILTMKIESGTFSLDQFDFLEGNNPNVEITGGIFTFDVSSYITSSYTCIFDGEIYRVLENDENLCKLIKLINFDF